MPTDRELLIKAERVITDAERIIDVYTGPNSWVGSLILEQIRDHLYGPNPLLRHYESLTQEKQIRPHTPSSPLNYQNRPCPGCGSHYPSIPMNYCRNPWHKQFPDLFQPPDVVTISV